MTKTKRTLYYVPPLPTLLTDKLKDTEKYWYCDPRGTLLLCLVHKTYAAVEVVERYTAEGDKLPAQPPEVLCHRAAAKIIRFCRKTRKGAVRCRKAAVYRELRRYSVCRDSYQRQVDLLTPVFDALLAQFVRVKEEEEEEEENCKKRKIFNYAYSISL